MVFISPASPFKSIEIRFFNYLYIHEEKKKKAGQDKINQIKRHSNSIYVEIGMLNSSIEVSNSVRFSRINFSVALYSDII